MCRLEFSLLILVVITICNAVKLFAIICTLKTITEDHFVTLGDAISSFLDAPDRTIIEHCLKARSFFQGKMFRFGQYRLLPRVYRTRDLITGD